MKKLIYSFSLMVVLSTLFACNNNDAPAIEEKPLPVYSYFRGYLNDEYINIEQNTVWDDRIFLQKTASMEDTIFLFNWYVKFAEDFNNTEELHHAPMLTIQLAPLRMGQYNITSGITYNGETAIYLGKNGTIKYIPNPKHPFKLYLNGIYKTSPHSDNPCISGTMEGVLYNSLNPNDSIVFHNVEFRRVSNYVIRQYITAGERSEPAVTQVLKLGASKKSNGICLCNSTSPRPIREKNLSSAGSFHSPAVMYHWTASLPFFNS